MSQIPQKTSKSPHPIRFAKPEFRPDAATRIEATDNASAPPPAKEAVGGPKPKNSAVEILAETQAKRTVIQDFRPLAESIEWELGQLYWQQTGSKAFTSASDPVPYTINNDGNLSMATADVFFESLLAADKAGTLDPRIFALEIGTGVGLFARFFLDALRDLCRRRGKDYYDRLCYVATDRSERMLADLCKHRIFENHEGHYRLALVDALYPDRDLANDPARATHSGRPFRAIFANYVLDVLPAAVLKIERDDVRQLVVRTCLARGVNLSEYTKLTADDLARLASSPDPADKQRLLELSDLLASEYDFRTVGPAAQLPHGDLAVKFSQSARHSSVLHSFGALQCVERLLRLLHDDGFLLVCDYGHPKHDDASSEYEHQRFAGSTAIGLNFPLVKSFVEDMQKCQWHEPSEDNGHIYSRLICQKLAPEAILKFEERFKKKAFDGCHEPVLRARELLQHGRLEAALAAFVEALERQPYNWLLMGEVAKVLTFSLRDHEAGLEMAKSALTLNPSFSADLWNTLGDALFCLARYMEARDAFVRALEADRTDVRARYNLAWVFLQENNFASALQAIADGLLNDGNGEYHDRLLEKQTEAITRLAQRNQLKQRLRADLISRRTGTTPR